MVFVRKIIFEKTLKKIGMCEVWRLRTNILFFVKTEHLPRISNFELLRLLKPLFSRITSEVFEILYYHFFPLLILQLRNEIRIQKFCWTSLKQRSMGLVFVEVFSHFLLESRTNTA